MKKFLTYVCIFAALVLALLIPAEIYVESIPNPARDKHEWMKAHATEVETLVLGSSHTFYGIMPSELGDRAFSLAQVSQTYDYDLRLLRQYDMPKLKRVILPYSYFSLWEEKGEPLRYRIYMDGDTPLLPFEFTNLPVFREKLKSLYKPAELSWDSLGFGTNYTFEKRPEPWDNGKERAKANTYPDKEELVAKNVGILNEIAETCKAKGVRLTLVTTPTRTLFRKSEDTRQKEINRRELEKFLKNHPEVEYSDFESDTRFTPGDFYDADHLNTAGARKLTSFLR